MDYESFCKNCNDIKYQQIGKEVLNIDPEYLDLLKLIY